jgi:predicted secreted protein
MRFFPFILCCISLLIGACSSDKVFQKADKAIVLKTNENFIIELEENHANGETWAITENFDQNNLLYVKSAFQKSTKDGSGKVQFFFETKANAQLDLQFKLIRYKDLVDVHTVNLTIK